MQYLAAIVPSSSSASTVITEQILEAGPLLEVFGNARTTRNVSSIAQGILSFYLQIALCEKCSFISILRTTVRDLVNT